MRIYIALIGLFASVLPAFGAGLESKIIGLLEIPAILGSVDPQGPPGQATTFTGPILLRAAPDPKAKPTVRIENLSLLLTREHGYEISSAVVFDQKNGWYQIGSQKEKGWIGPDLAGTFRSIETLLKEALLYLTGDWNGRLWKEPRRSASLREVTIGKDKAGSDAGWQISRAGAELIQTKKVGEELWFEVRVLYPDTRCDGAKTKPTKAMRGWVPAYGDTGTLNLWFFSRGC